jgi:biotin-(acetyl-CoA carboxylase) ligase
MEVRAPLREVSASDLALPPLFHAVRLRELGDAFAHAKTIARESGAGTLVHVGRFDLAEFALVLEPEEPLRGARRAFYAGMAALADALAAHAEPETAIGIQWPDSLYVNYGLVGGGRLAWPQDAREDETPPWLVFGAMIRIASMTGLEPGATPSATALAEEGFGGILAERLIESFARHFMVAVDAWQESGFGAVARNYLPRLPTEKGLRSDIDDNGDLLLRRAGSAKAERKKLVAALATPAWFDPLARGPQG